MIRDLYERLLADSEEASDGDGFLSNRAETHALLVGLTIGFLGMLTLSPWPLAATLSWVVLSEPRGLKLPYKDQLRKESLYLLGGVVIGAPFGAALRQLTPGLF